MQKLNIPSSFISSEQYSSMVTPNAFERHYRLFIPCLIGLADSASASGTRAAQMEPLGTIWNYLERPKGYWNSRRLLERRAAPYPYSKMCELCELCELLERKIPPLLRWDLLIYPQQNLFVGRGILERPKGIWNSRRLLEQSHRLYLERSSPSKGELERVSLAESCDFLSEPKRAARA